MPNVRNKSQHQSHSHSREQILETERPARPRDDLAGAFAGKENDLAHSTHKKERQLAHNSGKNSKDLVHRFLSSLDGRG